MPKKSFDKWQYGDFQTPIDLARKVVSVLKRNHNIRPEVVIEPTCGKGAFVLASAEAFRNSRVFGFEINPTYAEETRLGVRSELAVIEVADFFLMDWQAVLASNPGFLLVIGNPPWVTSSDMGVLNSENLPDKSNFQNRKGIAAITGAANFDVSEWMLLQHVEWLSDREGAIALLCKYSVARKVLRQVSRNVQCRLRGYIYLIDAGLNFGASVEACLFVLTTDAGGMDCEVYESLDSVSPLKTIGERGDVIISDLKKYKRWQHLRGQDPKYIWHSGVKHDCAKVMEFELHGQGLKNGLGESVECEEDYIYPLLKSSDIANGRIHDFRKMVLITQKEVGDDTTEIRKEAPATWRYLMEHRDYLDRRRSSIYRNKPPFSIFGIGDYSFKPWKVAISGFYKKLSFMLVEPLRNRVVVFDDTINFLSFDSFEEARFVYGLVTSRPAEEFLASMIFWDDKRPITVDILRRLSLMRVSEELDVLDEYLRWAQVHTETRNGQLELGIV